MTTNLRLILLAWCILQTYIECRAQLFSPGEFIYEGADFSVPGSGTGPLCQDREGFIWIAVFQQGLLRYDGQKAEIFDSDEGLPLQITNML